VIDDNVLAVTDVLNRYSSFGSHQIQVEGVLNSAFGYISKVTPDAHEILKNFFVVSKLEAELIPYGAEFDASFC